MIYNTVGDIFAANDDIRRRIVARVEGLDERQWSFRSADGAWSVAEIVEHLSIIEGNMVRLVGKLLGKVESDTTDASAPLPMSPFTLDEYAEQVSTVKLEAPEAIRPTGVPLGDSLARLTETRAALNDLRPRVEACDGTRAHYPHPYFGPLDLYQWLAFIGMHEQRHLGQIERLLESMPPAA
jgi:DinB superfamily